MTQDIRRIDQNQDFLTVLQQPGEALAAQYCRYTSEIVLRHKRRSRVSYLSNAERCLVHFFFCTEHSVYSAKKAINNNAWCDLTLSWSQTATGCSSGAPVAMARAQANKMQVSIFALYHRVRNEAIRFARCGAIVMAGAVLNGGENSHKKHCSAPEHCKTSRYTGITIEALPRSLMTKESLKFAYPSIPQFCPFPMSQQLSTIGRAMLCFIRVEAMGNQQVSFRRFFNRVGFNSAIEECVDIIEPMTFFSKISHRGSSKTWIL